MIAVDNEDFTLMSFVGDIDLDKMSRLSSSMVDQGDGEFKERKTKKINYMQKYYCPWRSY